METGENLSLPENEDHDTKKYKKHINDLIENAEIEAEMEAEKKIRSKNSRVFLISIFCFGLLSLVYLQIDSRTTQVAVSGEEKTASINASTKSAEEKLIKQVSINNFVGSAKTTPAKISDLSKKPKVTAKFEKKIKETNKTSKSLAKRTIASLVKPNTRFFIQTGAFFQKKNAEISAKKLQAKGFSPLIHVATQNNTKTYLVQLGVFPNKEKTKLAQEKLARAGYAKTIIK
jgi:cell division protein FtsN